MGVPTSEVAYTIATTRRETTKVHNNMWWYWGGGTLCVLFTNRSVCRPRYQQVNVDVAPAVTILGSYVVHGDLTQVGRW